MLTASSSSCFKAVRHLVLVAGLVATGCVFAARAHARAGALDPFRAAAEPASRPLQPFRSAQAEPAPDETPAAPPKASPPPKTQRTAAGPGDTCTSDAACPAGTICENGRCQAFERPVRVLLFRKEGATTNFIPFYWHRRGDTGHRVVAPFYWHFWSPGENLKVVWAGLPISWSRQTDARSFAIWPLFYKSSKFGWAAPLLLSFSLRDPDAGKSSGLALLLYYFRRDEKAHTGFDLFIPFFASSRARDRAFTWALPLNFYWRRDDDKHLLVPPLAYASWSSNESFLVTPLGYRSRSGRNARGAFAWLYWYGREPTQESAYDVLFPIAWSFRGKDSETTIVPPFFHIRRGKSSLSSIFPLAWISRDEAAGREWGLFLPLAFASHKDHGKKGFWLTPIGGGSHDDEAGTQSTVLLVPPFVHQRSPGRAFDMALGLYWHHRNDFADTETTVLGPYISRRDPEGSTKMLFPIAFWFDDRAHDGRAFALLPFWWSRRNPEERTTAAGIFPFLGYHRSFFASGKQVGWSAGLFPLAFMGSNNGENHAVVLPLLFHRSNASESRTLLLPLFYKATSPRERTTAVFPLLWFSGGADGRSHFVQFPLFWHFRDANAASSTTVVPPFFHHSSPSGSRFGLAPLIFARTGRQHHFVLAPLFWHFGDDDADRSTTVVANYMHRRDGGETTDALFPIFHYRRGTRPGGQDETSFTLLPFAHYRRDAGGTVFASPLAAWGRNPERKVGFVGPYVWYQNRDLAARFIPFLWTDVTQLGTGERLRTFGPWIAADGPGHRTRSLFPIFGTYHSDDEDATWVFPTFFHRRTRDGYAVDTLLPLFWYSRGTDRRTLVIGPWFDRRVDENNTRTRGLLPLFFYTRNDDRSLFISPLAVRHANFEKGTSHLVIAPLFYRSTRPEGSTNVLFPLWYSGHSKERAHAVLFPLYWHFENKKERTALTIAGPFFSRENGPSVVRGLAPIAWYGRDREKGTASHAVLPLFWERHGPNGSAFVTPILGFGKDADSQFLYIFPFFRRTTPASSLNVLAPLGFWHHDIATNTKTRVFLPLLHFARESPDRSTQAWLGIFWWRRNIDSRTALLFPIFLDSKTYHGNRTTFLLPLFFRHFRASDETTYTFAPLFYRRSTPTDSSTVLFPLIWDFRGPERRTTVFLPLYIGLERPTYTANWVFPTIYWSRGRGTAEGTSRFMVLPFWESGVKRPGDYMWEILFGFFGYERVGRNRYLRVLFIPFELEPAPAAQTAWYGRAPAARRPERRATAVAW